MCVAYVRRGFPTINTPSRSVTKHELDSNRTSKEKAAAARRCEIFKDKPADRCVIVSLAGSFIFYFFWSTLNTPSCLTFAPCSWKTLQNFPWRSWNISKLQLGYWALQPPVSSVRLRTFYSLMETRAAAVGYILASTFSSPQPPIRKRGTRPQPGCFISTQWLLILGNGISKWAVENYKDAKSPTETEVCFRPLVCIIWPLAGGRENKKGVGAVLQQNGSCRCGGSIRCQTYIPASRNWSSSSLPEAD